jgi:hypothetical protein
VEFGSLIAKAFLEMGSVLLHTSSERSEVLDSLGDGLSRASVQHRPNKEAATSKVAAKQATHAAEETHGN